MPDDSMWDFLLMKGPKDLPPLTSEQQTQLDLAIETFNEARQAPSIDEQIAATKGGKLFRPIQDFLVEEKGKGPVKVPKLTEDQVVAWMQEHPGSTRATTIKIRIGFPKQEVIAFPCLALVRYDGHVLVLNVDGKAHRFGPGEYEE